MDATFLSRYAPLAGILLLLALGRAWLQRGRRLEGVFRFLGLVEVGFLGLMLLALIVLGGMQIVLRNIFHGGVLWADPLMRHIVLWLGCLGTALATTRARHINIDVFQRLIPVAWNPLRRAVIHVATAACTFVLGVAAWRLVVDEMSFGETAFASVPVWALQLVLPVAFFLISYRSLVNLFLGREIASDSEPESDSESGPESAPATAAGEVAE